MKQILVKMEDEIKKILPETLKKDLQDDERICTTCNGLGVIAVHRPYGIHGDTSPEAKKKMFPYDHETLIFCPDCYNGVQSLCKHCGKQIKKGYINKCDCAEYELEQETIRLAKWNDTIQKAQEVTEVDLKTMLYCEETNKYYDTVDDFLEDWESDHGEDEEIPERLWVTSLIKLSFDASSILENACDDLHEDSHDRCDDNELQKLLDEYAERQSGTETYYPCYKQYVKVEKSTEI